MRVQIPSYTDRWMMGDRYGEIVRTGKTTKRHGRIVFEIAYVKLDVSGKTVRVKLDDCTVVS